MLSFAPNIRIFLHARPTDMRNERLGEGLGGAWGQVNVRR